MSKHTPGPWEVFARPSPQMSGVDSSIGFTVVLWGDVEDDSGVRGRTPEESQANARLIAAAPDLLAACEFVLPLIRKCGFTSDLKAEVDCITELEAAIAKAKGTT